MATDKKVWVNVNNILVISLFIFSLSKLFNLIANVPLLYEIIYLGAVFSLSMPYFFLKGKKEFIYSIFVLNYFTIIAITMLFHLGYNLTVHLGDAHTSYVIPLIKSLLAFIPASIIFLISRLIYKSYNAQ